MKASLDVRTLTCQHTIFSPEIHSPIRTVLIAYPFFFHHSFMNDMSHWAQGISYFIIPRRVCG
jgi:hypothetical protein